LPFIDFSITGHYGRGVGRIRRVVFADTVRRLVSRRRLVGVALAAPPTPPSPPSCGQFGRDCVPGLLDGPGMRAHGLPVRPVVGIETLRDLG
jgi:hypothetical protein